MFPSPTEIAYQDPLISVSLHPLEEKDAEPIHKAVLLSIQSLYPFMDWAHGEVSVEGQLARIRESKESYAKGAAFDFCVYDRRTQDFLMCASLIRPKIPNKRSLSIGYWTSTQHSNKGVATLITKILIVLAFDYMGCSRVEIGCNKANKQSRRVIEKCGFILEGQARNYFPEPTPEMLQNGYCPERTCLQYALIPQDVQSLSWFEEVKSKLTVKPSLSR